MSLLVNFSVYLTKPTGITTYGLNVLPALAALHPTVLSPSQLPVEIPGITVQPCPTGLSPEFGLKGHAQRLVWTQLELPTLYRQTQASLLFSPLPEAPWGSACRSVVMVHDLIPLRFFSPLHPLRIYCQTYVPQVLRTAQHILCNSQATANDIQSFYGIASHKITPIPLGYDTAHFRDLGLPQQNYFLYLGRTAPYKNVARVLVALAQLRDRTTELWLVGPRDRRTTPQLQAQAEQLGIGDRLRWLDYVDSAELPRLINQAIALVWPSLWEGFGLPVLEAMACGTPVITSNLASLPEVVGQGGLLIDPYDTGAIAAAMTAVLTQPGLRAALSRRAIAQAAGFSWPQTGLATRQVLERYL